MRELEKCLRYGRKEKKLAQSELARMAGVETGVIINLESGIFVPLNTAALRRIAAGANLDESIFVSLYKASFSQELKALRSRSPSPLSGKTEKDREEAFTGELTAIGKVLLKMPADIRDSLLKTIRMLVHAQAADLQGKTM